MIICIKVPKNQPRTGKVSNFPYLIIKENDLRIASCKNILRNIPHQGGLHRCRKPFLKNVHVIEPSYEQVYMARRLSYNPHWGAMPEEILDVETDATKLGTNFTLHSTNKDYVSDVLTVLNHPSPKFESICPYYDSIDWKELLRIVENNGKKDARGNITLPFGYAGSQNYSTEKEDDKTYPRLILPPENDGWHHWLEMLTNIANHFGELNDCEVFNDKVCNKKFAHSLYRKLGGQKEGPFVNKLEAVTVEINNCKHMLRCHLDSLNDNITSSYDRIICASRVFDGKRISMIRYSRKSIANCGPREARNDGLLKFITNWFGSLPSTKKVLDHEVLKFPDDNHGEFIPSTNSSDNVVYFFDGKKDQNL